jgi:hypothetical protein
MTGPGVSLRCMAPERQASLIDLPDEAAAPRRRRTSKGLAPGDIVEVDKKGRRFHALVEGLEQQGSGGRFELELSPLARGVSYRRATVREVVGVWRRIS